MPMDTITDQLPVESEQWSVADEKTLTETGFYWRERDGVKVLVCRPLEMAGFANGFSTRLGGVSSIGPAASDLNLGGFNEDLRENIFENRRRFFAVFDESYKLATARQIHGDNIRTVGGESDLGDSDERADALVSDLEGVLLGVKTADCVPILVGDRRTGAFAAVHAGWRGTARSIAKKVVVRMTELFLTDPSDLMCAIGPAAGCEKYEIGEDVVRLFHQNFPDSEKYLSPTRAGHALIDLKLANKNQLVDAGIVETDISIAPFCTMARSDLFFSYRIEKSKYGRTGRLLSVIGKRQ
jgi:YfiH family protein